MTDVLPRRSREVVAALAAAGVEARVRVLPEATRTAAEAARVLGCEVGQIANSLVFVAGSEPVLVMTSGRHRVQTEVLDGLLGLAEPLRRATPEEVRLATGQVIGGVAPVGHPRPLPTVVDRALFDYELVHAAAGTPHSIVDLTPQQLARVTAGRVADVRR
ncbi:YbaK/EbsC family protein [Auraticoccus sp. F435]|uniref:YbaK/EbsC family protein n=1 Tax=Auraticoccus cholistanensis TaxID=2656650 RepID=A0A6A9V238_9ACTN|nr:YbaK/EbsC family protein [Auraticoccus cholistanensis]MVA77696.1 YbaK/EbsC family protein [Auraticoccus cholistanensis]